MIVTRAADNAYLRAITSVPLLTAVEEVALGATMAAGRAADSRLSAEGATLSPTTRDALQSDVAAAKVARNQFVTSNMRLVAREANRLARESVALEDLIQAGTVGLIEAVDRWDHTRGNKFSTYGIWWIRQAIHRLIEETTTAHRVPGPVLHLQWKIAKVTRDFAATHHREPTPTELAALLGVSVAKVTDVRRWTAQPVALDMPTTVGDPDGSTVADTLADATAEDAFEDVEQSEAARALTASLRILTPIEAQVLRAGFGVDRADGMSLTVDEIGATVGLRRGEVKRVQAQALARLRHPANTSLAHTRLDVA